MWMFGLERRLDTKLEEVAFARVQQAGENLHFAMSDLNQLSM
jgi:hypothetical protein